MGISLQNKVALITGANRGIGKSILESFLKNGATKVYAAVRNVDSMKDLVKEHGEKIVPLHVDMSKAETIKALANKPRMFKSWSTMQAFSKQPIH